MKKLISILSLSLVLMAAGCESSEPVVETTDEMKTVVTSFYPLHFLTSELSEGVENIEVINLIESGGEPHSFEPSPSQLAKMERADLVIVQGSGLEPWFEGLEHGLEDNGVSLLEVNSHLDLMSFDDDHDHGEFDPHTWLDPVLALDIVEHITEELMAMDPENEALYLGNAVVLEERLRTLDEYFENSLVTCELDAFITSHDAFSYLAARYGLHAHAVSGISPFDEPSASQITELIEIAEEEGVAHIFFEVLANSEAAEVLADEAGLTPLVLNPIAGLSSEDEGEDYFTLMYTNLDNLKIGLACDETTQS